jgi:para-aminobenzoate synthetase component 1
LVRCNYSAAELFAAAKAPFTFWLEGHFLAFSPEPFVTVRGCTISTTPMKGTGTDKAALLADAKEQAEHATVVDLLRNDLSQVASKVRIEDYRFVSQIRRADGSVLYQTSSRICGEMPADWREHIGDWLPRLLPAGSISGAPKKETLELIRRFESEPRGFFTGVAVLFDGENLASAVLIRFLDLTGDVVKFRSGAGITIYSDPAQEYDEIVSKVYFPL